MRLAPLVLLLSALASCGDSNSPFDGILPGEPDGSAGDQESDTAGAGENLGDVVDKVEDQVEGVLDEQIAKLEDLIAEKAEELAGVLGQLGDFAPKDLLSKKGFDLKQASTLLKDEIARLKDLLVQKLDERGH